MRGLYHWLLYLYPQEFRREFGEEMDWVLADASSAVSGLGRMKQSMFVAHEVAGILCGALQERVRTISALGLVSRRIGMSSRRMRFRFPVAGIGFMVLSLGVVLVAIRNAREISQKFAGHVYVFGGHSYYYEPSSLSFMQTFGFVFGTTLVLTVVVWAVLHLTHRSGVHRLSDAQTWPQR